MKDKMIMKSSEIMACYKLLEECVSFIHIEDKEYICKNLNLIKEYKNDISKEAYSDIEKYVKDVIRPIVYDVDYFEFLRKPEYGSIDEKGHFVINSDRSLETIIFLMYDHTLELNKQLQEMISEYIK